MYGYNYSICFYTNQNRGEMGIYGDRLVLLSADAVAGLPSSAAAAGISTSLLQQSIIYGQSLSFRKDE